MSRIGTPTVLGNYIRDEFIGDGFENSFQLSAAPGSVNAIDVYVGNAYQHNSYTVFENWLIFDNPIPDTEIVYTKILGKELQINHPADGSVDEAAINTGRNSQIREALELVKQTTNIDITADVMSPGAFGLGGEAIPPSTAISIDDNSLVNGIYRYSHTTTPGTSPPSMHFGMWIHFTRDNGLRSHQISIVQTSINRLFVRNWDGTVWSDWVQIQTSDNIASQVQTNAADPLLLRGDRLAASAGFPFANMPLVDGVLIVESGSNSDGEWTRWADGTQIASGSFSHARTSDGTFGIASTVPFPITFTTDFARRIHVHLALTAGMSSNVATMGEQTVSFSSETAFNFRAGRTSTSGSQTVPYIFTAYGRWF